MASGTTAQFPPYHKWDRNFFLIYVALIWLGIVMGFGGDIQDHIEKHKPAYPLIVHFHAVAFVGWMFVLTAQVLLIRRRQHDLHRKLGIAAMMLAASMIVLGLATAIIVQQIDYGTKDSDPAFFATQFTDILAFAGLVTAAFLLRNNSSAHKRLILMATIYISDAGFDRWLGNSLHGIFSGNFWTDLFGDYLPTNILFVGIGIYDLVTRRRLHPVYIGGMIWILAMEFTAHYSIRCRGGRHSRPI